MILNNEKTVVSLRINADLTAPELDALLRKLALLRADMTPEVSHKAPGPNDPAGLDIGVLIENEPGMTVAQRADGGFRFWLRSRGIGWVGYNVPLTQTTGVYKFLHAKLGNLKTGADLFSEQDGQRH